MKRSKHSLSNYKLGTFDMGSLVPVGLYEVLPGDTVQQATSCLVRCSPLLAPVMHPVVVRIHHWFVPYRLVWSDWEKFITGGSDGEGDGAVFPTISSGGSGFARYTLPDYMGIPPLIANRNVSALPIRAFNLIYNKMYRDQDIINERAVPLTGGADTTSPLGVPTIAWEKDYFTVSRPWPQKGPDITIPVGGMAPVLGIGKSNSTWPSASITVNESDGTSSLYANAARISEDPDSTNNSFYVEKNPSSIYPNIVADLSQATGIDIRQFRELMGLQRFAEARAMFGHEYVDYLRFLGIRPSDARLQRPEYLGGGKQTLSFSEVLQTGVTTDGDDTEGVGNMKGHGISALRSNRWRKFFEEHGVVITLASIRPRAMYSDGIHRMWSRTTREDFWQKELELIGQQEILHKEIYAASATPDATWSYGDRYDEYRHNWSTISGEFRESLLNFWHMARIFGSQPTLNPDFINCVPTKRVNAVQTNHVIWSMFSHSIQARRMVRRPSIPRIM